MKMTKKEVLTTLLGADMAKSPTTRSAKSRTLPVSHQQRFFWARVETSNFTFDAFGATEPEALAALEKGWREHQRQSGAWLAWEELREDIGIVMIGTGRCFRDREIMP